ncbi:kinesin-like protein KIN-12F isoform X2 [Salvia splendens]|uniref:kinesin-like protein KIN-12F isoform X2 n=1 Tax=Salvia splendens TaxID=180675 RepID=UPI001C25DA5A|nr:kinesin-like protein KIN-12F isoform X2 [Salvia splendens]
MDRLGVGRPTQCGDLKVQWWMIHPLVVSRVSSLAFSRIFFSKIQQEQGSVDGKKINYQFRCSFLEVYDDKIGDLLDPTQRDLEIKDDVKNGFYVENLTEEYVACYEDITQILIKGGPIK